MSRSLNVIDKAKSQNIPGIKGTLQAEWNIVTMMV